jgi:3-oxoacyl-[acyl-carrier protein] reductase
LLTQAEAKSKAVAEEIRKAGGQAISVSGDVTDPAFPEKLIGEAIRYHAILEYDVPRIRNYWYISHALQDIW